MKETTQIEHSIASTKRPLWRKLWRLNVPTKVHMFLWQACSNVLPTRENLHKRKVQVDPHCAICCQQPESVGHLLWECPLARNVWALCRGGIQKCTNSNCDFFLLFQALVEKLLVGELERRVVTTWAVWNVRNKYYFKKTQTHLEGILSEALGFLQEYQMLMAAQHTPKPQGWLLGALGGSGTHCCWGVFQQKLEFFELVLVVFYSSVFRLLKRGIYFVFVLVISIILLSFTSKEKIVLQ